MTDSNTTNGANASDILDKFKTVPDVRSRATLVVLAVISIFAPIVSAGAFGISTSLTLVDVWGAMAFLLPACAGLVLIAPIVPALRSNCRLIDLVNGGAAAFAAFIIAKNMLEVGVQLNRSYGGIRGSDFGSMLPSWGMIFFVVFLIMGIRRGLKALKARPSMA
ncbi:hypothetical protein [Microvirga sp. TS319]|uniref:hypothetical protein n=1 Tax=Microvirga sp. TS319 TaxID=3241165 RepID=UPI00351A3CBF